MAKKMLSSGFVRASGFAIKLRRTLIAQTKPEGVDAAEAVRCVAPLNMQLYRILVEKEGVKKDDVVRIRIMYDIVEENGKKTIKFDWDSCTIEIYRKEKEITGIEPPKEMMAEVGEWREFPFSEELEKRLKLLAVEMKKEGDLLRIKGEDFEAEIIGQEKIRIRYLGPQEKLNEFFTRILGESEQA